MRRAGQSTQRDGVQAYQSNTAMSRGNRSLLGDACHPMYPFMGQGAAQAIEDGAALAACLVVASDADPVETLREYERLRLPRVTLVQAMSRANKIRFHMPDGLAQRTRDAEWTRAGDRAPDALCWLYAFDAGAVVNKSRCRRANSSNR
jgi:salicylate hydroxylase